MTGVVPGITAVVGADRRTIREIISTMSTRPFPLAAETRA
jgi:hypothetical protein